MNPPPPVRHGRLTARLRIALSFAALFFVGGAVILGLVYGLVRNDLFRPFGERPAGERPPFLRVDPTGTAFGPTTITTAPTVAGSGDDDAAEPPGTAFRIPTQAERDQFDRYERQVRENVRDEALQSLLLRSGIALGGLTLASGIAGWAVAGLALRPVHRITEIAKVASTRNLDQRVHLPGPRDELTDLADTFDAMLDRLQSGIDAQRRFAANAAHELRTPLTVIRTAVDVGLATGVAGAVDADQAAEAAADIRSATIQAEELIGKLLEFARSEHGVQDTEEVDLAERCLDALAAFDDRIVRRGVRVTTDLGPAPVAVDPVLVDLAIGNLVGNAVTYCDEGGAVTVACRPEGDGAVVVVENDGPLLDDDQVARIADPFVRGGGARLGGAAAGGSGLGLSIVRAVADAHGGRLELAARPDGGLHARLLLPASAR